MDRLSPAERSAMMRRIRSKDTRPELLVRKLAHAAGYRYRLQGSMSVAEAASARRAHPDIALPGSRLPGKPDLVFASRHKAVFVNGCFWHRHHCPAGLREPGTNHDFWVAKRSRNQARDAHQLAALGELGWDTLVLWECELHDPKAVALRLEEFLGPHRG
ncbi:very short patch repair endonuclease [Paeniglutamicibacter cryotolerans]|uniref:DNA mismatch endonuclease (Patch repair protein) n=1 Tax=Paeniglutamicibacter cryotolerans TaxID=670079 RepID=A0A839QLX2_9MICC|nr:very short patch repair endonuclease [Paeniglutamicibacter cryotolerans]MBB2995605.1 DNA mismatch endonuclease (patch repair protein) [Paeniglutamicibacter cryotolerans]